MRLAKATLIFMSFAGLSARADSPWVNRHNACREIFEDHRYQQTPQLVNFVYTGVKFGEPANAEDVHFKQAWGYVNVFRGTNSARTGLWLTGAGNAYFTELPVPETQGAIKTWKLEVATSDARPAAIMILREAPGVANTIDVFAKRSTARYDGFQTVKAELANTEEAEKQSADVLVEQLRNYEASKKLTVRLAKSLERCDSQLSANDAQDTRIAYEITKWIGASGLNDSLMTPVKFDVTP